MNVTSNIIWRQPPQPEAPPTDQSLPQGWALVSWLGGEMPVWELLGNNAESLVSYALRWNSLEQRYHTYRPGRSAEEAFAVLPPRRCALACSWT